MSLDLRIDGDALDPDFFRTKEIADLAKRPDVQAIVAGLLYYGKSYLSEDVCFHAAGASLIGTVYCQKDIRRIARDFFSSNCEGVKTGVRTCGTDALSYLKKKSPSPLRSLFEYLSSTFDVPTLQQLRDDLNEMQKHTNVEKYDLTSVRYARKNADKLGLTEAEITCLDELIKAVDAEEGYQQKAQEAFAVIDSKCQAPTSNGLFDKLKTVSGIDFTALRKQLFSFKGAPSDYMMGWVSQSIVGFAKYLQEHGKEMLDSKKQQDELNRICEKFIDEVSKDQIGMKGIVEAVKNFFNQDVIMFCSMKIPFTNPAVENPSLAKPQRHKKAKPAKPESLEELQKQSAQFKKECIDKGTMMSLYWILVQLIGGRDDTEITPYIEAAYRTSDPKTAFFETISLDLDSSKIPTWRRIIAKGLWHFTPCHRLIHFLLRRSITVTEAWCDAKRVSNQGNYRHIPGSKAIESTLKKWITANQKIQDAEAYENEISAILSKGNSRKARINQFTNFLVDTCFPAIDLIGWHERIDLRLAKAHQKHHKAVKPIVWLGAHLLRFSLLIVKYGSMISQRLLNFTGRFSLKFILKRLGVMHKLFDFRSRLHKGDHHTIEDKLKGLSLLLLKELNAIDMSRNSGDEDEQLKRVNQNVEQTLFALLRVLDLHDTHRWDKEGIKEALKGNWVKKTATNMVLPIAIQKGVTIFNETIWKQLIVDDKHYSLVKSNLFESLSNSLSDPSPPPPEIDREIETEIHQLRTELIRQILLRSLADLGEEEHNRAQDYVKELQAQKETYASWKFEIGNVKDQLETHDAFDLTGFLASVRKGLTNIDTIYRKYLRPLKSATPKVTEIHNLFLMPIQTIEACAERLNTSLQTMLQYRERRKKMEQLQASWRLLNGRKASKDQIGAFKDRVASENFKNSESANNTIRDRKDLLKDKILCDIVIQNLEHARDASHWEQNRCIGLIEKALNMLKMNKIVADVTVEEIEKKRGNIEKELKPYALPEASSIDELEAQLGALHQAILENSSDFKPYETEKLHSIFETVLELVETSDKEYKISRLDRVIAVQNQTAQCAKIAPHIKDYLDQKGEDLKQKCQNWNTDPNAAKILKDALHKDQLEQGKVDITYLIQEKINDALIDECIALSKKQEDAWKTKAKTEITSKPETEITSKPETEITNIEKALEILEKRASDEKLSIPYLNLIYSPNQDEDPLWIQFLVWVIGEASERITQKIIKLSHHTVFLKWGLGETILTAAAA